MGVREEQRFENLSAGMEKSRVLERSWDSMRATLREAVEGLEPGELVSCKTRRRG